MAHEALIREWGTLKEWVDQDREFLRTVERVKRAMQTWSAEQGKKDERLLPPGRPLEEARELLLREDAEIDDIRPYIAASISAAEIQDRVKARSRRRTMTALASGLAVMAILLAVTFLQYRKVSVAEQAAETTAAAERSGRAVLLAREPGDKSEALAAGISAIGPFVATNRVAPSEALVGLQAALEEGYSALAHSIGEGQEISFSSDNSRVTGLSERRLWVGDVATGQTLWVMRGNQTKPALKFVKVSPDLRYVVGMVVDDFRDETGELAFVDARTGSMGALIKGNCTGTVEFSPNGKWLLGRGWFGGREQSHISFCILDVEARDQTAITKGDAGDRNTWYVAAASDRWLLVHSIDDTKDRGINVWDARTGRFVSQLKIEGQQIREAAISKDETIVATIDRGNLCTIWDPFTGNKLLAFTEHAGPLSSVRFANAKDWIATAGADKTVRIWDPRTGHPLHQLSGDGAIAEIEFSHDDAYVLALSQKGISVWEVASGELQATIPLDGNLVESVKWVGTTHRIAVIMAASSNGVSEVRMFSPDIAKYLARSTSDSSQTSIKRLDQTRLLDCACSALRRRSPERAATVQAYCPREPVSGCS